MPFHTKQMMGYNTQICAGVTPGKGGKIDGNDIPIFNSVTEALNETEANASVIFVPPQFSSDACI